MSVPLALEAILSQGQAYGLQLHKELTRRLPHRSATNVGQIYSTLDRLVRDGYITQAGTTEDALPLYSQTMSGRKRTEQWIRGGMLTPQSEWIEFLDVIMMASSIPNSPLDELTDNIARVTEPVDTNTVGGRSLTRLHEAIAKTLDDALASRESGEIEVSGLKAERPLRGRRPRKSVQ